MIAFACTSCQQKLSVPDGLAGQKVQCPGCAQVLLVPGQLDTPAPGSPPGLPLQDFWPTIAPAANKGTGPHREPPTASPPRPADSTRDPISPLPDHDPRLTSFLAPPQAADELGRLGPYRVLGVLGAGGMGVVFQAEDPGLQRLVALKAMLPSQASTASAKERFLREARSAAALKHPHIVTIFQVGEDRGVPYLAMEYLEGEPLDRRLKRERQVPIAEVLRIGREMAEGLCCAHDKGLIHRDIKPANIWLESAPAASATGGHVKILDFGLARALGDQTHLTQSGAIVGTPAYMAPEQAAGKPVDPRCDLFCLGCVLYRLATDQMPFKGADTMALLNALAVATPTEPAKLNQDIPAGLNDLIVKLLAKKPEERPAKAQEVVAALRELERHHQATKLLSASPSQQPRPMGKRAHAGKDPSARNRRKLLWSLAGVLVAAVVCALLVMWPPSGATVSPGSNGPQTKAAPDGSLPPKYVNSLGMAFVLVPKGKSWLGGGNGQLGDKEVVIAHDFYLGMYEVTHREWEKVMRKNPSSFKAVAGVAKEDQERFPVETVSWEDAQVFVKVVNLLEKETGWEYRLPTEEEWEYACRGGPMADKADSAFDFYLEKPTNELKAEQANFNQNVKRTCKVGSYAPNRLGCTTCTAMCGSGAWMR